MLSDSVINILCLVLPVVICSIVALWRNPSWDDHVKRRELFAIFFVCAIVYIAIYFMLGINIT